MIKHLWSILASGSSVDQQTNTISIFGILEELTAQVPENITLPALIPLSHTVISFWQKEPGKEVSLELGIEVIGPGGDTLAKVSQLAKFPAERKRMRTITQMDRFPLAGAGEYKFRITTRLSDKKEKTVHAELPLDVIIPKSEE